MNEPRKPLHDDRLEARLDGLPASPGDVVEAAPTDATFLREKDLQGRIDGALDRLFKVEPPTQEQLIAALIETLPPPQVAERQGRRWWTATAAAVVLVGGFVAMQLGRDRQNGPVFAARPLVDVYRDVVADGFEPYYECREADRFADTFARRQGQPLQLLPLPEGVRMLGLSYPGGLSRDTTAMLCHVDGQPVMVFVDRAGADQPTADDRPTTGEGAGGAAQVFRIERHGLVFYEVTPLALPRVVEYLAPVSTDADAPSADDVAA